MNTALVAAMKNIQAAGEKALLDFNSREQRHAMTVDEITAMDSLHCFLSDFQKHVIVLESRDTVSDAARADDAARAEEEASEDIIITVADLMNDSYVNDRCFSRVLDCPENTFLCEINAESEVGKQAEKAIIAGLTFAATLDPHPAVLSLIGQAVVEHIRILYLG